MRKQFKYLGFYDMGKTTKSKKEQFDIHVVISRFKNFEIKIKIDKPEVIPFAKQFLKDAGFILNENKFTYEIGRYYWVEKSLLMGIPQLHNSMDILRRNRSKEIVNLSELNGL